MKQCISLVGVKSTSTTGRQKKPIFTKQQLSRMGLKPIDPAKYEVHKVVTFGSGSGRYKPFHFYTMDNVQSKRANANNYIIESI